MKHDQSPAEKHQDQFDATIERQLPTAMVAMTATAMGYLFPSHVLSDMLYQVRAVFDELSDGREFSANIYEDTYLQHVGFLKEIEEGNNLGYVRLMSDLYMLVMCVSSLEPLSCQLTMFLQVQTHLQFM